MEDSPAPPPEGRTRWRRFAAAAIPSIAAAGALVTLMANGAIAASFAVSGQEFKVSGDSLDGSGFVQFGFVDASPSGPNKQDPHAVVISGIKNATIHNLCQSVVTTLPIVGPITLRINAGTDPNRPVTASNLVIDLTTLKGDATFSNIQIGNDAFTGLNKGPDGLKGLQNSFAQQADSIHLGAFQQTALATTAGTFTLPNLDLGIAFEDNPCFK